MTETIATPPPLVSVIVPAFNAAQTIAETLGSIAQQTYGNLEILIVDDGSTDETSRIARDFCASEPRARLIGQENRGVAAARNAGLIAATGRFAAPIDADDLWHPDYVATLVRKLVESDPQPVMAYAASRLIDAGSRVLGSALAVGVEGEAAQAMLFHNLVGNGSAMMFDRALALRLGGYDPRLHEAGAQGCEDLLLQLMLASNGPVAATTSHLVGYRRLPQRMSADDSRMARSERLACRLHARATGIGLPRRWDRWKRAAEAMRDARASEHRGNLADAVAGWARAFWLDPIGAGMALVSRLIAFARRFQPRCADFPDFLEVDPDERSSAMGKPDLFYRLHQRRLHRLAISRADTKSR